MKSFPIWRALAVGLLLLGLGLGVAVWLLGTAWGKRQLQTIIREKTTKNSELELAPFDVDFSIWRDFPHVTASLRHFVLTDTTAGLPHEVLRVDRADLRLDTRALLQRKIKVTRIEVTNVLFAEQVDSLGRHWGLRGKRQRGSAPPPKVTLDVDSLVVHNFVINTRNGFNRSAFNTKVRHGRVKLRLRDGILLATGVLDGQLAQLKTRSGVLMHDEPIRAWVNYRYVFENHRGTLWRTRATLNGDTINISGTHTVAANQQAGTLLNIRFEGPQPLLEVLNIALPPSLRSYLEGAVSPSKAQVQYTISGLSGPRVRPHNVLKFGLDNAQLIWPDSARRINRWDLRGVYDNGAGRGPRYASLTLERCRIHSSAGQLDLSLKINNFVRPHFAGRLHGRAELPDLAAIITPEIWQARRGLADLDIGLHGYLPPAGRRRRLADLQENVWVRGTVTLRGADFTFLNRAHLSDLNVRVGLRDSLWQLSNASGLMNGMRFKASATTVGLLDYIAGETPVTQVSGQFAVEDLSVQKLRYLLRPLPRNAALGPRKHPRKRRSREDLQELATRLGNSLIPAGLHLDADLRCRRLLLSQDTLRNLAVTVKHDGHHVQLQNLAGRVWDGQLRGNLSWPTDTTNRVAPVKYQLAVHFDTLDYERLLDRLTRPPRRPARPNRPASPALADILLAANGSIDWDVNTALLPDDQQLRQVRLRFDKQGNTLHVPNLSFSTPDGASGQASATVLVENRRLVSVDADLNLHYATLDIPDLLELITSLTTPPDSVPPARQAARARRQARRLQQPRPSLMTSGALTAVLRVQADKVRYAAVRGTDFRLVTHLRDGEATVDDCSVQALQGRISLRGRLRTNMGREHHPLHVQARLEDIALPDLFTTISSMGVNAISGENIRGRIDCAADIRTDLGPRFLPSLDRTRAYLKADIRQLELVDVEFLKEALSFMKAERTGHLFFEPVSTEFLLNDGQLLIPRLVLNSNLTNLTINGTYGLDGRANLFVGLKPFQALFGDNQHRIERIQTGEPLTRSKGKLMNVNLRRMAPGEKYKVRLFQGKEQREGYAELRRQRRELLTTQRLDTTMRLLPSLPAAKAGQ
ncbi:AsmA-like C-terminal region-containing protein [Hymenobacter sp. ASUV-10]|uniref:AsmA-like C-terminal region-containing protein n=1 Tax=Hymenobacter aranciens TaxID=3063996 RepID=A0ABT9BIQ0_9BACT|nr:AsmA-like C-terminal region-containing protein [Hymenobacter sp. ASUV-10]MDO7877553.1 AsmA-like C-terminal region-containing protein [Hymenobacter sp. ASUV-10]